MMGYQNQVFYKSCEDMSEIPDGVVQTCVTSPPYFGLRDYGNEEQIGQEATLTKYINRLVCVFREVKRVLRNDGTLWLNLGDSYASAPVGNFNGGGFKDGSTGRDMSAVGKSGGFDKAAASGLKQKDLIGVPWRVAFALQSDGWWLRSDIIWHKTVCMPESVTDRPTRNHEYIFLLAKSSSYYYDQDAIRDPNSEVSLKRVEKGLHHKHPDGIGIAIPPVDTDRMGERFCPPAGANKRTVWKITPAQYPDAHFATFPPEIPSLCIRAGSKPGDLVLDPFAGSGTTLEIAEVLGRSWIGYELNKEYRHLIEARLLQQGLFGA